MSFSIFTSLCGIAVASFLSVRPSVRPSVSNVEVSWLYNLEFLENNFTPISPTFPLCLQCRPQHYITEWGIPWQILAGIGVWYGKIYRFLLVANS